jgi:hypothetical protein
VRFLLPLVLLAASCTSAGATDTTHPSPQSGDEIRVTMSLYVVTEATDGPPSGLSSQRDLSDLEDIATRVRGIWAQAGIDLEVATVARVEAPVEALVALGEGDTSAFLERAYAGAIVIPQPSAINGFYVSRIGTANGMTPIGTRVFFVADDPSVKDERVSSHEVGHILGLHHALDDAGRLMFSGTNGTDLTDEEIEVARYGAAGVLDGVR